MSEFRIDLTAGFTVTKKQNADYARDAVIAMLKNSGFEEKDFVITVEKTGLVENAFTPTVGISKIKIVRPTKEKKIMMKRKTTDGPVERKRRKK